MPEQTGDELLKQIREIDDAAKRLRAEEACRQYLLTAPALSDEFAVNILKALRGKRLFEQMKSFAERALEDGASDWRIEIAYAQAMIDDGQPAAAERLLLAFGSTEEKALAERNGLLGRINKDRYIRNPRLGQNETVARLLTAIDYYRRVRNGYGNINLCALLARAAGDGITLAWVEDPVVVADDALAAIKKPGDRDVWDNAIGAEATLALKIDDAAKAAQAEEYLRAYLAGEGADAFEVGSTLRQFEEVWLLDEKPKFARVMAMLRDRLMHLMGGEFEIPHAAIAAAENAGDPTLRAALEATASVGRIVSPRGAGAGFLTTSDETGRVVFVTDAALTLGQDAANIEVWFGQGDGERRYPIKDVTVLPDSGVSQIELQDPVPNLRPLTVSSTENLTEAGAVVRVVGRARGDSRKFAVAHTSVVKRSRDALYYVGSSRPSPGSPVFDQALKTVVGMNRGKGSGHLDDGTPFTANQAVPIRSKGIPMTNPGHVD